MKNMNLRAFISAGLLLIPAIALPCSFNTDCQPGSTCQKPGGSLYGVCVGGMMPGNSNDRVPVSSPLDPNGSTGNTCSFNTDCGPGGECVKSGIYGVCMRRR
jgi:hypothetical protein